jgi:hypothetical protein
VITLTLWEKAEAILDGGEALLIASEDIFALQALTSIPQLVSKLETNGHLSENSGLSKNCVEYAHEACRLIFEEIQKRLAALIDTGHQSWKELEKAVNSI